MVERSRKEMDERIIQKVSAAPARDRTSHRSTGRWGVFTFGFYGQNARPLRSPLCAHMAADGDFVQLAGRAGLLHDLGKAVTAGSKDPMPGRGSAMRNTGNRPRWSTRWRPITRTSSSASWAGSSRLRMPSRQPDRAQRTSRPTSNVWRNRKVATL